MLNELGSKIRELRQEKGLTIAEISDKAELTVSMLSQVERGIVSPSISSLRRIAAVLNVPAFYFLVEEFGPDEIVVRREERRTYQVPGYNTTYQLLTPGLHKRIETIYFELPPGEATCETPMAHEGEESLTVISGRMQVVLPDQEIVLETGDSIYIDRYLPHKLINVGEDTASAICAISPPSF